MVLCGFLLCYLAGAGTVAWFGRAVLFAPLLNPPTEPTKTGAGTAKENMPKPETKAEPQPEPKPAPDPPAPKAEAKPDA
jgi:hypothetical protein